MKNLFLLFFVLLFPTLLFADSQQAVIVRVANLYSEASSSSEKVEKLNPGLRVDLLDRSGGWKKVQSVERALTGWVRTYQVRELDSASGTEIETESDSRGFLAGLASWSRKASGFFNNSNGSSGSAGTATIGVRGLSQEAINTAKPDFDQFELLKTFASHKNRMANFKEAGHLRASKVPFLKKKK
ncbi:MAG: hypothetical protein ACI845_003177 [Gammaproteobacteria bacterium]